MHNISGTFELEILGKKRDLRCTFGAIEALEGAIIKRPLISLLNDALTGEIYFLHVLEVVLQGLKANGDTRFDRNEVGEYILEKGLDSFIPFFIEFLTYASVGSKKLKLEPATDEKKN